ncbi:MAG: ferredoxin [Deltaproteobacteria bacterium]|nr:MAG: ferredoxin [Deltaproteobacteria bacterium]
MSTPNTKKCLVTFKGYPEKIFVDPGTSITEAARTIGVAIPSICGGQGKCQKCRVEVSGFEKPQLACQFRVYNDVQVIVPEDISYSEYAIDKEVQEKSVELSPAVKKYSVTINDRDLLNYRSKWEFVEDTLRREHGLKVEKVDYPALAKLKDITESAGQLDVSVWMDKEIIDISAPNDESIYGIAVDIGTTTLAAYLCDLSTGKVLTTRSMLNPQVACGEDILSRITYCLKNRSGVSELHEVIIQGVNRLIKETCDSTTISSHQIMDMALAGNSCMLHLFLGVDVATLGVPPFQPVFSTLSDIKARDLGIEICDGAYIHVLPLIAGFIGADTSAVILSEEPYKSEEVILIIDAGTNGELVLGNRDRLMCTSCATGPALEGGSIICGMRASPGAIDTVKIDPANCAVEFTVIPEIGEDGKKKYVKPRGICGSGIIDCVAQMYLAGVISKNGHMKRDSCIPRIVQKNGETSFVVARASETDIGEDIVITQGDVRSVQLAKAAIQAALRIMIKKMKLDRLSRIVLAGAFGNVINIDSALALGMFPDCPVDSIEAVGNAAGDGARIALLNTGKREEIRNVVEKVEHVDLVSEEGFQREFAYATYIPRMESPG